MVLLQSNLKGNIWNFGLIQVLSVGSCVSRSVNTEKQFSQKPYVEWYHLEPGGLLNPRVNTHRFLVESALAAAGSRNF